MPGVDDGAQAAPDAQQSLEQFRAHGVGDVIATPHFSASLLLDPPAAAARLRELDGGWERLQQVADTIEGVRAYRGAEVMLDAPQPDFSDARIRLAGGRFVLVEMPFMSIPPNSARVLTHIRNQGFVPVLAHPERYHGMAPGSSVPVEWKAAGALLQVNGPSLLGKYGKTAKAAAADLLARGLVDYLASDYHARGSPLVQDYRSWMDGHNGAEQAELLMVTNPARLLRGEMPLPVMPLRREGRSLLKLLPWNR